MIGKRLLFPLVVISTIFILDTAGEASPLKVVCYRRKLYYGNGVSNNENCTDVVLQVGTVDGQYGLVKQPFTFQFISTYKKKFPHIKLILGLDPSSQPSGEYYPKVVASNVGRSRIIKSAIDVMKSNGYDGLDLIFAAQYVEETAEIASGVRKAIGSENFTISGYFEAHNETGISDIARIAKNFDFMTMECYKPTKTNNYTELAAPLYYTTGKPSVSECMRQYLDSGVPHHKVLLAIQTYAVTHTLDDADEFWPGSSAWRMGWATYPGNEYGLLYLYQVTGGDWEVFRDETSNAPYSVNYLQWASYDDNITATEKAKFIKENGLGGAALTTRSGLDKSDADLPFAKLMSELLRN